MRLRSMDMETKPIKQYKRNRNEISKTIRYKSKNEEIRASLQSEVVMQKLERKQLEWYGHPARME